MTQKELARLIGCSRATFDRVLNNRGGVSSSMRQRIIESIKETGFQVNSAGKVLAMQNRLKFGIIISSDLTPISNQLFDRIYKGMKIAAKGFSTLGAEFYFVKLSSDIVISLRAKSLQSLKI